MAQGVAAVTRSHRACAGERRHRLASSSAVSARSGSSSPLPAINRPGSCTQVSSTNVPQKMSARGSHRCAGSSVPWARPTMSTITVGEENAADTQGHDL
jgi:hypothetical protein